eukprot:m.30471 g.30471  ORF g.30471 m.30471 type:complete len:219 (+) comp10579_c0_seq1:157-813(+)
MLYFAFGSNLDPVQMTHRCPSATFYCRATLPGRRLAFTLYSVGRGCGVADIVRSPPPPAGAGTAAAAATTTVAVEVDEVEPGEPQNVAHTAALATTAAPDPAAATTSTSSGLDDDCVWGVVYDIPSEADIANLDRCEGFGPERRENRNMYERRPVTVHRDGNAADPVAAQAYFAIVTTPGVFLPNDAYMGHITRGARHWQLPAHYLQALENHPLQQTQ